MYYKHTHYIPKDTNSPHSPSGMNIEYKQIPPLSNDITIKRYHYHFTDILTAMTKKHEEMIALFNIFGDVIILRCALLEVIKEPTPWRGFSFVHLIIQLIFIITAEKDDMTAQRTFVVYLSFNI
jgi:hypothetical protein